MNLDKPIFLIGYRGTGKSSVAAELAERLSKKVLCTDQIFEERFGRISDYVANNGWDEFRKNETQILNDVSAENAIIDCGGGIIEKPENREILNQGLCIWLTATVSTIQARIQSSDNRPSLSDEKSFIDEISEVLERRTPIYDSCADLIVQTDDKIIFDIVTEIHKRLNTKSMLCIPIAATNAEEFEKKLKQAELEADIIELRIDSLSHIQATDLERWITHTAKPLIVTCRAKWEGGEFTGTETERIDWLKKASGMGADFVDLEFRMPDVETVLNQFDRKKVILSWHNFEKTPGDEFLNELYGKMAACETAFVKIVSMANSATDNFIIFRLLKKNAQLIAFCMGIAGQMSRVLTAKFGGRLSFGLLENSQETAPGQFSARELKEVFGFHQIDYSTKVLGIIGEHAENSQSKNMHNPIFQSNGLNAVYVPFKIKTKAELEDFVKLFRLFRFTGASVTIPHKELVKPLIDAIDPLAEQIGAVNTLVNRNGHITGFNTDWIGCIGGLTQVTSLVNKKVLLMGAGGAARAIAFGILKQKGQLTLSDLYFEKAKILAGETGATCIEWPEIGEKASEFDILVNATPVGMYPKTANTPLKNVPGGKVVMDIVYLPIETRLIKDANQAGCQTVTGEKMLIRQAMAQQKVWFGLNPDYDETANYFYQNNQTQAA